MNIIAGSSHPDLAATIVAQLNATSPTNNSQLVPIQLDCHANGEKRVWIKAPELVRGQRLCIVQSFDQPADEKIIETLLISDALERLGARGVSIIIPWLGYSLQDKVFRPGEAIAAKVVADLVSKSFIKRVFLLDLHNSSIPGFFSIPSYHLFADQLFIAYLQENLDLDKAVIASPDFGGLKRARTFSQKIGLPLINIDKSRDLITGEVTANAIHGGSVTDKIVILFDDVIVSGGTAVRTAELLKKEGASAVHFLATHGIFCNQGLEKIQASEIASVVVTNSIAQTQKSPKLKVLDLSKIFAQQLHDWL